MVLKFLVSCFIGIMVLLLGCATSPSKVNPAASAAGNTGPATIIVQPIQGAPAAKLAIYGSGFVPGERVKVTLTYGGVANLVAAPDTGGVAVANDQGAFKFSSVGGVPGQSVIQPGVYTLEAAGDKGSRATTPLEVLPVPKK